MDDRFWRGKRVLITGHTGFKGSWLAFWLIQKGAVVSGYSLRPNTQPNLFTELKLKSKLRLSVYGDIRDLSRLKGTVKRSRPQIVFHMTAQPLVLESYRDPVRTFETNVMGTVNLLESCRNIKGLRAIVNVTTDKVYANQEWSKGYSEEDRLGGFDPYSSSKTCSELVTSAYMQSYFSPDKSEKHGVAICTARSGNVIGGGDWADNRLVPDIMRGFIHKKKIRVRNPKAIRPWQHVLEPLHGYLLLAEKLFKGGSHFSGAWNFGPSPRHAKSVEDLMNLLSRSWGKPTSGWVFDRKKYPKETTDLRLVSAKAAKKLGFRNLLGFQDTIRLIAEWYRAHAEGENVVTTTLNQISYFEKLNGKRCK